MGGCHVVTILPHIIPQVTSLPTFAAGAASAGVALGVAAAAYGAYVAVRKLQSDYQQALDVFHEQQAVDQAHRETTVLQQQAAAIASSTLVSKTQVRAVGNATLMFLHHQVTGLQARAAQVAPELTDEVTALATEIQTSPGELAKHFEHYRKIAETLSAKLAKMQDLPKQSVLAEEFAMLRVELDSPLFATPEGAPAKVQMRDQLTALEALPERQVALAAQGIDALRRRVHREMKDLAERLRTRAREAVELRTLVSEMLAKLHAVAQQESQPAFATRAKSLLQQVTDALVAPSANNLTTLRALAPQVTTLFTDCEKALEEARVSTYVAAQVTDALLNLGYKVAQAEPEAGTATYLTAVDAHHGLQVSVEQGGRVAAEMVAFTEEHAVTDPPVQEKVCAVTQALMKALAARDLNVREKFRHHYDPGTRLKVVKPPAAQAATAEQTAAAPKVLRMGE